MKNTGIIITITVAILAVTVGGYFLWQKGIKSENETTTQRLESPINTNQRNVTVTNTPQGTEKDTGNNNIDTELKNLDLEMNSAFQKDSDTDPTTGI